MPDLQKPETIKIQTAQTVDPAAHCSASYRLLFNGDLLAEGCESLQDDAETWIPTEPAFLGTHYNCEFFRPMRMPNDQTLPTEGAAQDS